MKARNPLINGTKGTINDMVYRQVQDETVISKMPYVSDPKSEAQTAARSQFGGASASWKTLTPDGRASYSRQAATMMGRTGKPMKGKALYVQIAATLNALGEQAPDICPRKPDILPAMPQPVFLSGYSNASSFVLLVHSDGIAFPVIFEAIQAVSAGVELFNTKSFRVISVTEGLFSPSTALQTPYANKFGKPFSGTQVAVRLTPFDPSGYRGNPVIYSCFVAASAEEMEAELAERKAKAVEKKPNLRLSAA